MKVVLDTNILVSAVITPHGPCAEIMDLVGLGVLDACVDSRILREYDRVLHKPGLRADPLDAEEICELLHDAGEVVGAVPLPLTLPHPPDVPFLEVASAGRARLVTGNQRHFPKRQRAGVQVLSPRELLDLLRQEGHGATNSKEEPR